MPLFLWILFFILIAVILAIDLFFLGGSKAKKIPLKEALCWTAVWVGCSLLFGVFIWIYLNNTQDATIANQKALEFFTGYLIEKSLSIDNVFVILMTFIYFKIPLQYQKRVLMYGIFGAIVLRLLFILGGVYLIQQVAWVLYIFGAILVLSGIKMFFHKDEKETLSESKLLRWIKKICRVTPNIESEKFFIKQDRWIYITPLFLALIVVEISDIIFAFDSIPAIFSITKDPFIIFTSNIFAILGLRALYFLLSSLKERFHLLHYGLAIILCFIGIKMLIVDWISIPTGVSLGVIIVTLLLTFWLSARQKGAA